MCRSRISCPSMASTLAGALPHLALRTRNIGAATASACSDRESLAFKLGGSRRACSLVTCCESRAILWLPKGGAN